MAARLISKLSENLALFPEQKLREFCENIILWRNGCALENYD
jgi:hypothetical protein